MEIGFFFWPFDTALVDRMATAADRYGYDMIGIADTPGNAMDPWVAATMVAMNTRKARLALVVTNLVSRHPAVSAAAIASLDRIAEGRTVLGLGAGHSGTRNLGMPRSNIAAGVAMSSEIFAGPIPSSIGVGNHAANRFSRLR